MSRIELEVFDQRLFDIFDEKEELETVNTGFEFLEGPVWHQKDEHLTFSDIPASKIYRWRKDDGLTVLVEPSNKANGHFYDTEGRLVSCEHATSVISRRNADGTNREVLVSKFEGKELNSPNDLIVKSDGSIYFSDPLFGRSLPSAERVGVPRDQELDFQGVYRYVPETDELKLLNADFEAPNGLCFSLDEKLLYVNDTTRLLIKVFDVEEDGTITGGRLFAQTKGEGEGRPDGLKIDSKGNVYCAAQGGLHIFNKEGSYLGILKLPEKTANFTWGGPDLCDLFCTSSTSLYRTRVKVPGVTY